MIIDDYLLLMIIIDDYWWLFAIDDYWWLFVIDDYYWWLLKKIAIKQIVVILYKQVIRPFLKLFIFFYDKISQVKKAPKGTKKHN